MTRKFEIFIEDGVTYKVYEPTVADYKEAAKVRNTAFVEAIQAKAPLRGQLNTLLRSRGEWDDERENQYNDYTRQILERERKIKTGGIKLAEARKLALEIKEYRGKMQALLRDRSILDNMTAEGQADNAHFNALVSLCLVYNNDKDEEVKYFNDVDEYLVKGSTTIAITAANKLSGLIYGIGENAEKSLEENKFLIKYKFVDDQLRLINKDGHLIDQDGRLINDRSEYVDKDGNLVDKFGNPVGKDGQYIVEEKPFLDDDGKEIIEETTQPVVETESIADSGEVAG
jgi:hypothetical protein